eukprot:920684-Prorocentrum_minimum.AAC.2
MYSRTSKVDPSVRLATASRVARWYFPEQCTWLRTRATWAAEPVTTSWAVAVALKLLPAPYPGNVTRTVTMPKPVADSPAASSSTPLALVTVARSAPATNSTSARRSLVKSTTLPSSYDTVTVSRARVGRLIGGCDAASRARVSRAGVKLSAALTGVDRLTITGATPSAIAPPVHRSRQVAASIHPEPGSASNGTRAASLPSYILAGSISIEAACSGRTYTSSPSEAGTSRTVPSEKLAKKVIAPVSPSSSSRWSKVTVAVKASDGDCVSTSTGTPDQLAPVASAPRSFSTQTSSVET